MKKTAYLIALLFLAKGAFCQEFNADPNKSFINLNLPRTPESQGMENYGKTPVSELTGKPDISVPVYNLKSRFMDVPITLSYNASGIKVNQEASWVGLGFDLIYGGRVTLEVKGNNDFSSLWQTPDYKVGVKNIFTRLGNSNANTILTYATTQWELNDTLTPGNPDFYNYDDTRTMESMAWYGAGEPDIYHANFGGNSFSFYFDLITDSIKFIGERTLCTPSATRSGGPGTPIIKWTIVDTKGIAYYFDQIEKTEFSQPSNYGVFATNNTTTAWLLTKMIHPTGDSIVFTYANYGTIKPAYSWSASLSTRNGTIATTSSDDNLQNKFTQSPAYITKIESSNTAVDFILSDREDLEGAGARRLDEIRIKDKQTGIIKRKIQFSYDYFHGNLESPHLGLSDAVSKYYRLRLKLNALYLNDSTLYTPYRFYYNIDNVPEKYSFRQDHWGFYNGVNNLSVAYGAESPQSLVPKQSDLFIEKVLSTNFISGPTTPPDGAAASRKCDALYMKAMTLDSIVYPTGGSTGFSFEPHQSDYFYPNATITGGGLRIKIIRNYGSDGLRAGTTDYTYDGGVYMGAINYLGITLNIPYCPSSCSILMNTMSSSGEANESDILVGYSQVRTTYKDEFHKQNNGSVVKYFNIPQAYEVALNHSIDTRAASWPVSLPLVLGGPPVPIDNDQGLLFINPFLNFQVPTPRQKLDGKLVKEDYFDNNNQLLKSIKYYYKQEGYTENLYSIKAKDNFSDGMNVGESHDAMLFYNQMIWSGVRRYTMAVSPAKSFFTITDSVVETTYSGTNTITQKKSYKYNQFYQPEFEITDNSDGTQKMIYTKTPLSMQGPPYSLTPVGDALSLALLRNAHMYESPVEQLFIKKSSSGDSTVLGGRYNLYNGALISKSYQLESSKPLPLSSQFIPSFFNYVYPGGSTYSLKIDDRYVPHESADYTTSNLVQDYSNTQGKQAFIWDTLYNTMIAKCVNAVSSDIAYTSFEGAAKGNWSYSGAPVTTPAGITGQQSYNLSSGSISKSGLSATASYIVSYWSKNGSYTLTGSPSARIGRTAGDWIYYEHLVVNPSGGVITISGSGSIDELRLYPVTALMSTYTYNPLIGISSECDPNNHISYYEYDALNRLLQVRNQEGNIVKRIEYKYLLNVPYPYANTSQSVTFTKNDCDFGYAPTHNSTTVAAENTFGSFVSIVDANQKALDYLNENFGQDYANENSICTPDYHFTQCCNFESPYASFALTGTGAVNFSIVVYKTGDNIAYGKMGTLTGALFLPAQSRTVTATSGANSWTLVFYPNGDVNIMGPNINTSLNLTGSYNL